MFSWYPGWDRGPGPNKLVYWPAERAREINKKMIREEILCALKEDSPESIVLGSAGMADLAKRLSKEFEIPVIDGVASAVKIVEGIIVQGLKTSKAGGYAIPPRKIYKGRFSDDQLI